MKGTFAPWWKWPMQHSPLQRINEESYLDELKSSVVGSSFVVPVASVSSTVFTSVQRLSVLNIDSKNCRWGTWKTAADWRKWNIYFFYGCEHRHLPTVLHPVPTDSPFAQNTFRVSPFYMCRVPWQRVPRVNLPGYATFVFHFVSWKQMMILPLDSFGVPGSSWWGAMIDNIFHSKSWVNSKRSTSIKPSLSVGAPYSSRTTANMRYSTQFPNGSSIKQTIFIINTSVQIV